MAALTKPTLPLTFLVNVDSRNPNAFAAGLNSFDYNFAMNLSGNGEKPSRIKVKMKPSILVNGQPLSYPGYVTVKTEFSGVL